jgi:hypothetical protein
MLAGHSVDRHLALLASEKLANVSAVIGLTAIRDFEKYSWGENSCQSAAQQFINGD